MNEFSSFLVRATRAFPRSAALVLFGVATVVHAQPTGVQLPAPAKGAAAISALGAQLPTVAKAYGLDPQALINRLQTQPSLVVDRHGALHYACDGLVVNKAAESLVPNSSVTTIASGGTVDAFKLHSMPGATRVIYLDFTGHTTTGTAWNSGYTGGNSIVSAPFDLDGSPSTFNSTECALITAVWKRVAEDYAPFAIDVTTEDPGIESLRKTSSTDTAYGVRVVISPTNWYNTGAGGVAYVGSFSWDSDTPCFAFTDQLLNGEKYIADAVSHEVGHTLGLSHDGVSGGTEYYAGQGNWAPIMGVGYYQPTTQFSKGEYANANNKEDDLAIISGYAPYATDDVGGTPATARVLVGPSIADGGTIERTGDVDMFRFDTGAGAVALSVTSPAPEADLHMKVDLLDASGNVLATNAATQMDASFSLTLNAGTYYLRITGIGQDDPVTNGYSNYASLGNYLITGTVVATTSKSAPVAVATASTTSGTAPVTVTFTGQNSYDTDGTIVSFNWDFGNGTTSTAINPTVTYSSAGTYTAVLTVTDNDGLMGSASVVITVTAPANVAPVAVATSNVTTGTAPVTVTFSSAGSYDPDGSIVGYRWDFGDGTSATTASASKTYSTAGTYTAKLTVTDNSGATASSSIVITVASDPSTDYDVQQYTLALTTAPSGSSAVATIYVRDRLGRAVANASVTVQWSGLVSGNSSGKTDTTGRVVLTSAKTKKSGSITGTITAVSSTTGTYDATIYTEPLARTVTR